MITLKEIALDRTRGTGLCFSIRDSYSWKPYFIKKYHIFNPKNGNIFISDIIHLKEKNNKEIESLDLGVSEQSVSFITNAPVCNLIRKRKPINLKTDDIYYIPTGEKVKTRNYMGKKKRTFTHGEALVCELYIPSNLFEKIYKIKDAVDRKPTYKLVRNQHKLRIKNYEFIVQSDERQVNHEKNKNFLSDLEKVSPYIKYGNNPLVTAEIKETILNNMREFISKYENFEVED